MGKPFGRFVNFVHSRAAIEAVIEGELRPVSWRENLFNHSILRHKIKVNDVHLIEKIEMHCCVSGKADTCCSLRKARRYQFAWLYSRALLAVTLFFPLK